MKTNLNLFFASIIGNIFEIFDFFIFIFLSPIIANLFFPKEIGNLAIFYTYVSIAISYFIRPIGGILLGNLGDRYGRKSIFTLSIFFTAFPSLIIGLLPTYNQIGIFAPIILILARIMQGFSSGAELPGSITYIAEKYYNKNYYFYCAWIPFGANIAVGLGSISIKILTTCMPEHQLYLYGWRIPFLLGSILAIIGFYIRTNLKENSQFIELIKNHKILKSPVKFLLFNYYKPVLNGIFFTILISLVTSIFHVFLPNLYIKYLNLSIKHATNISSLGAIILASFIIIFSFIKKNLRFLIIKIGIIGLILIFILIILNLIKINNIINLYLLVAIISIFIAMPNSMFAGIMIDLFPTNVRYSGIAFCYSISSLLGAGITPIWTSISLNYFNNHSFIILVCLIFSIIALINSYLLEKRININTI